MTQPRHSLLLLLLLLATPLIAQEGEPTVTITMLDDQWKAESGTAVLPRLPEGVTLSYPLSALTDGIEGSVPLSLSIDATGAVLETRMLERPGIEVDTRLLLAAIDVVKSVTFSPGTIDGAAAAMPLDVTVMLTLPAEATDTESGAAEYPEFVPNATPPSYNAADLARHVVYPPEARRQKIEGTVYVTAKLDETGKVIDATVIRSAGDLLDAAALAAVGKTTFTPGMQNGTPIRMKVTVPIAFRLVD